MKFWKAADVHSGRATYFPFDTTIICLDVDGIRDQIRAEINRHGQQKKQVEETEQVVPEFLSVFGIDNDKVKKQSINQFQHTMEELEALLMADAAILLPGGSECFVRDIQIVDEDHIITDLRHREATCD